MGLFHDLMLETKAAQFEKDIKEAYSLGFRDGRLCPVGLRPCEVDGAPALFHSWTLKERGILKCKLILRPENLDAIVYTFEKSGVIPSGCDFEKVSDVFAIVEYPDGSVSLEPVEKVRFTDREEDANG